MKETLSLTDHFFDAVIDNAAIAGFDGYFKRVSRSWSQSLGWSIETLKSRPIIEFVHPDDRDAVLEHRARLGMGEVVTGIQNRYRCKGGGYRWFEWRVVADVDRELIFAVARDITEDKQNRVLLEKARIREEKLHQQLVIADRMATVGTLAAGMAHEINNPLVMVTTNVSLLREDLSRLANQLTGVLPENLLDNLDEMAGEALMGAQRIEKIVRGLGSFSAARQQRIETLELVPVVERIVQLTHAEIRHRARLVEHYGVTPPIEADESELGQVVLNLIVNAAQAIPAGDVDNNVISIRTATTPKGFAVLEVEDTGGGIAPDVAERIFDPFFTTKPIGTGTGIGLSVCHAVVERMGGTITVESEVGRGTKFRVLIPGVADTEVMQPPTG